MMFFYVEEIFKTIRSRGRQRNVKGDKVSTLDLN